MQQIDRIELNANGIIKIGWSLRYNFFHDYNPLILNVYFVGVSEPTEMTLGDLLDEFESDITFSCNKALLDNYDNTIQPNTSIVVDGKERLQNYFSKFVQTSSYNGVSTFTFSGDYDNEGTTRHLAFTLDISVNGIVSTNIEQKFVYCRNNVIQSGIDNFEIYLVDGFGNNLTLEQANGLYSTYTLTITKNGTSVVVGTNYTKGIYVDTFTFFNKNQQLATQSFNIYCYNDTPSSVVAIPSKTNYLQYEYINTNDLSVYLRYEIDSTHNYDEQIYSYTINPDRLTNVSLSQTITISYNGLSTTYNVVVSAIPQDNVYYFDKKSPFSKHLLGELQCDFNMSLTIDESKDSCKVKILSFVEKEVEPNTFIYFESTDTWWCVEKDKVDRHQNEQHTLYEHTLSLVGAIEVLGSRDLTNCGFNSERYTIKTFLNRLKTFSDFELPLSFSVSPYIDNNEQVNYIKTFENYTFLSALKEFFNGYNAIPKMKLNVDSNGNLVSANVYVASKSGTNNSAIDISVFDDTTQQTSIDKENYGTRVVSNIQNCVSRKSIKYPAIGCANLVGSNGEITYSTTSGAKLLLPSDAYYVESITFYCSSIITIWDRLETPSVIIGQILITPDDLSRKGDKAKSNIVSLMQSKGYTQEQIVELTSNWENIFVELKQHCSKTIYNGGYHDAIDNVDIGDYAEVINLGRDRHAKIFLNNENYSYNQDDTFYFNLKWQQGKNDISGFDVFSKLQKRAIGIGYNLTELIVERYVKQLSCISIDVGSSGSVLLGILDKTKDGVDYPRTMYSVSYVPMTDIKVKTENDRNFNDTKLYNQNGKLIDSYAVSKLVNGYAQSVSSNEIVVNKNYYNFFDIPQAGQRVVKGNDIYVINNVSIDFYMSDNNHYVMPCQFNMTKYSACKSFMVSANSKIRDYDCPQQNNIKRIQCYRDYIELDYTNNNVETSYLNKQNLINISTNSIGIKDNLCCFVRAEDSSFNNTGDNNSHYYYYRIPHTIFSLNKHYIIVSDFNDNNIIGYGNRNANKPFALSNIFDSDRTITVPISYVDLKGEVDGLETMLTDIETAQTAFGDIYISDNCSISSTIYNTCKANSKLTITENNYNKDGLEIPVFEYCAECGDTNGIVMADNFFEYDSDYNEFVIITYNNLITNQNSSLVARQGTKLNATLSISNNKIIVSQTNTSINLKDKNVGVYARKGQEYRFLFSCNGYKNNLTYIDLYINNYKLN